MKYLMKRLKAAPARRRVFQPAVLVVVLLGVVFACNGKLSDSMYPTGKHPYDPCPAGKGCGRTDNKSFTVVSNKVGSPIRQAAENALYQWAKTDLTITYHNGDPGQASPEYNAGNNAETDLIIEYSDENANKDGGAFAVEKCDDLDNGSPHICDQTIIIVYHKHWCQEDPANNCTNERRWRYIMAHEIGHSIGLVHGENSNPPIADKSKSISPMNMYFNDYINNYPDYAQIAPEIVRQVNATY